MTNFIFTIIDFRNVTKLFADKDFDGDPVKVKETDGGHSYGRNGRTTNRRYSAG